MRRVERLIVYPEPHARAIRHVGRALTFKIGQQHKPVAAGRNARRFRGKFFVGPVEVLPHHLRCHGHVHSAQERQPLVSRIAERCDFTFGIDHRFVGAGVNRAAGSEAGGDYAGTGVAGADRPHHVVAAASADKCPRHQVELPGRRDLELARRLIARD